MEYIILGFSSDSTAEKIREALMGTSYKIVNIVCHSGAELLRTANEYDRALIIMGFKLSDMTVNDICENLHSGCRILSVMRAEHTEDVLYDEIMPLPLPINRSRLIHAVNALLGYIPSSRGGASRSQEENALIDRAKLLLIERYNMGEEQAHRFIQKRSMDTGSKAVDIARAILYSDQ